MQPLPDFDPTLIVPPSQNVGSQDTSPISVPTLRLDIMQLELNIPVLIRDSMRCLCRRSLDIKDNRDRFDSCHLNRKRFLSLSKLELPILKAVDVTWDIVARLQPEDNNPVYLDKQCITQIYDSYYFPFVYFESHVELVSPQSAAEIKVITRIKAFVDELDDNGSPMVASGTLYDDIVVRQSAGRDVLRLKIKHRTLEWTKVHQPGLLGLHGKPMRFLSRKVAPSGEGGAKRHEDFKKYARLHGWLNKLRGRITLLMAFSGLMGSLTSLPLPLGVQYGMAGIGIFSAMVAIFLHPAIYPTKFEQKKLAAILDLS
ncbi:hypothetical protein BT69DRAFT_1322203 [Atractiella rhizophila]|nr:hypothetical protein BT69DRAFT_1322203 [Atractiella rhizophila]